MKAWTRTLAASRNHAPCDVPNGKWKPNSAFTLAELLIVVSIIAILAAIAVPNFLNAQIRAKVASAKNSLRILELGLEAYRVDNHTYPYTESYRFNLWVPPGGRPHMNKDALCGGLTSPISYLTTLPQDPFKKTGMLLNGQDLQPINSPEGAEPWLCPDGEEKELHLYVEAGIKPAAIEETTVNYERHGWGFLDDYETSKIVIVEVDGAECERTGIRYWLQHLMTYSMAGGGEKTECTGHAEYVLFSLGPDRQYGVPDCDGDKPMRSHYELNNRYDPTNGTISPGNILHYQGSLMFPAE